MCSAMVARPSHIKYGRCVQSFCATNFEVTMMYKYEVILYWSDEDGTYVTEVPKLPGCIAHGPTQEAALASVQEAIRLWIDTAREFGDLVPAPKG